MSEEVEKKEKKPTPKHVEYVGRGKFLHGLPARRLTLQEWRDLPGKQREHVLKLGLYEVIYD
jgi:hypothetical protein